MLFIAEKREPLDENDEDKVRKGEVCRRSSERRCRVKLSEGPAEVGGDCWGERLWESVTIWRIGPF